MEDSSWEGRNDQERRGVEGEEGRVADDDHDSHARKSERGGRSDGRGGTRVGTTRKNREGRAHQSMLAREECEGVTRGATGGQRRGRNECTSGEVQQH